MIMKNLLLSFVCDVPSSCLGSRYIATVAAKQLPEPSELSQLDVFHVHLGHPVWFSGRNQQQGGHFPESQVAHVGV